MITKRARTTYEVTVTRTPLMDQARRASGIAKKAAEAKDAALRELQLDIHTRYAGLPDAEFWPELDRLLADVKVFRDHYKRSDWVEAACDDHCRREVQGAGRMGEAQFAAAVDRVRFALSYELKVDAIRKAFQALERAGEADFGISDDGFSDLCDSFPMHGRETFEAALKGRLPAKRALGENYVATRLEAQALRWLDITLGDLYEKEGENG